MQPGINIRSVSLIYNADKRIAVVFLIIKNANQMCTLFGLNKNTGFDQILLNRRKCNREMNIRSVPLIYNLLRLASSAKCLLLRLGVARWQRKYS